MISLGFERPRAEEREREERKGITSTYISISGPQQLLGRIEGEGRDDRGHRLPARWREELTTQLSRKPSVSD